MSEAHCFGGRLDLERPNGWYADGTGNAVGEPLINSSEDSNYMGCS
jgi:hypothetical protein